MYPRTAADMLRMRYAALREAVRMDQMKWGWRHWEAFKQYNTPEGRIYTAGQIIGMMDEIREG